MEEVTLPDTGKSIVVLDGGMGQELVRRSQRDPTPLWSSQMLIDQPDIVRDLHIDFIRAGARVITLNAYSVTPQRLQRAGLGERFVDLQSAACQVAIEARELSGVKAVRIAGCLPPLVGSYRAEIEPDYEPALSTYRQVVEQQKDKVDVFLCETVASLTQAKAAATASLESGKPTWVALTIKDDSTSTLRSGEPLSDAIDLLNDLGVDAILLNCSQPEAIDAAWPSFGSCSLPTGAYANGFTSIDGLEPGGTVQVLQARQDLGPEQYAKFAMKWVDGGATIVGGCCEVGPAHMAKLVEKLVENGYSVD